MLKCYFELNCYCSKYCFCTLYYTVCAKKLPSVPNISKYKLFIHKVIKNYKIYVINRAWKFKYVLIHRRSMLLAVSFKVIVLTETLTFIYSNTHRPTIIFHNTILKKKNFFFLPMLQSENSGRFS